MPIATEDETAVAENGVAAAAPDDARRARAAAAGDPQRRRRAIPSPVHSAPHPAPTAECAARPEAGVQQQRAVRAVPAGRSLAPGHGRPERGAAPPPRQFGPDAEKGGGRKKGKKGKRSSVDQDAVQANILKTLQGMKGPAGRKGVRRSDEPSYRDVAGRPAGRGAASGRRPGSGSTSSSRCPSSRAP